MNPSGQWQGGRQGADDLSKAAYDQKLLTARLFRSQGQHFHPGVAGPQPPSTLKAFGTELGASSQLQLGSGAPAPLPSRGSAVPSGTVSVRSTSELRALPPPTPAPVGVPRPLQPLLGPRLNLRTTSSSAFGSSPATAASPADGAGAGASAQEVKTQLSRTGRLPMTKAGLQALARDGVRSAAADGDEQEGFAADEDIEGGAGGSAAADAGAGSAAGGTVVPSPPTRGSSGGAFRRGNYSSAGRAMQSLLGGPASPAAAGAGAGASKSATGKLVAAPGAAGAGAGAGAASSAGDAPIAVAVRDRSTKSGFARPLPPAPLTGASAAQLSATEVKRRHEEYVRYLQSPFSFIDKVIESPFTEEFVYLNPKGPYSLSIVKHSQVQPDNYYTMSRAGVTHFHRREATFTSLDQWEREYFLYVRMMDIPFFRKFRGWKAFYFWKRLIAQMKAAKSSKHLGENLYTLNRRLCAALLDLRRRCVDTQRWSLLRLDPKQTLTLVQFCAQQEEQRETVARNLVIFAAEARRIVATACDNDLKQFLIENGFRKTREGDADIDRDSGSSSSGSGSSGGFGSSSSASSTSSSALAAAGAGDLGVRGSGGDDFPQKISRAEKAAQRTKCKKLAKFVRLADFHIIHTLAALCQDRVRDLLKTIDRKPPTTVPSVDVRQDGDGSGSGGNSGSGSGGGSGHHGPSSSSSAAALALAQKKKRAVGDSRTEAPLFTVELELDERTGELAFTPTLEEFQQAIEQAIDTAALRTMSQRRMIQEDQFQEYAQGILADLAEMEAQDVHPVALVLEEPALIATKQKIAECVLAAFNAAWAYARGFATAAGQHMENIATNVSALRDQPVHVLAELIAKHEQQAADFEHLRTNVDIGILNVDTTRLKAMITPSPKACRAGIVALLPVMSTRKTTELREELQSAHARISRPPTTVDEFVTVVQFMRGMADLQDRTNQRYTFIQDLHGLMQESQVRISDAERLSLDDVTRMRQEFKTTLMLTEASMQTHTDKFSKDLEGQAPQLNAELDGLLGSLKDPRIFNDSSDKDKVVQYLLEAERALLAIEEKIHIFQDHQETLGLETTHFEKLREAKQDLNIKLDLWRAFKTWSGFVETWMHKPFEQIDVDEISRTIAGYNKICGRAKRHMEPNSVVATLKAYISEFASTLPVVSDLRNPALLDRHWAEINKLLDHKVQQDPTFSLGTLIEKRAMEHSQAISNISVKARQEASLQDQLDKVTRVWDALAFPLLNYKREKDTFILGDVEEILITLDDSLVTVGSVLGSHYVEPLRADATTLMHKLQLFQATLEQWTTCQRQWMYLEPIFVSQDIARSLPEEAAMFDEASKTFVGVMRRANDTPQCFAAALYANLKENLQATNEVLDRVAKRLENYLETKRAAFPRFYFLANDELIKILSDQKNHLAVQPHLRKCFDNLVKLEFAENRDVQGMFSSEGEYVKLYVMVKMRPTNVETWLNDLEKEMMRTLRVSIRTGLNQYDPKNRRSWILNRTCQSVMTGTQVVWTTVTEKAVRDGAKAMQQWYDRQLKQLTELTQMVRSPLPKLERDKIVTLITTDVHSRDVTRTLIDRKVTHINDFNWQQQLRFYWDEDEIYVRQSNARLLYGYEYMGVTTRLVITPLTDRCWLTITGALHIRFGASPAGPAGTGKTESVKDLAKALGQQCIVYNCSEQVTYKTTQKLFSGLAQTGAWTCLDEFNRIDIEVLSVIAQQLMQIRHALIINTPDFKFEGQQIRLKTSCGVMITMNPGYAGRTELPDNLKVLFRPVSMMVPDYAMIAENMLFSEGFEQATSLSKKMVRLYKLASEQLSQQDHYDFGMRAVKSVLVMAGTLKRAEPGLDESMLLIRAMRDSNIPKFLAQDLPLFNAIVQDLFPDVKLPQVDNVQLATAIKTVVGQAGLQAVPRYVSKVVQLYDTLVVRFGAMLVGPTGGGKSACWRSLQRAMTLLGTQTAGADPRFRRVHTHVLNPKSVTSAELFGDLNELSQEWHDGVASSIFRDMVAATGAPDCDRHWILFDGPVDALWIENMNTVLDDNMMLCLPNGGRIKLNASIRVMFEVQDLAAASPATVSRCGMVYMTPTDMGVMPYIRSWLDSIGYLSPEVKTYLFGVLGEKLPAGFAFLAENKKQAVPVTDLSRAVTVCRLLEVLLQPLSRARQVLEVADIKFATEAQAARVRSAAAAAQGDDGEGGASSAAAVAAAGGAAGGGGEDGAGGVDGGAAGGLGSPTDPLSPGMMSPTDGMGPSSSAAAAAAAGSNSSSGGALGGLGSGAGPYGDEPSLAWGQDLDQMRPVLDMCVAFAYTWGLGGSLDEETHPLFSKLMNELFLSVKPPGTFFDVHVDVVERQWRSWDTLVTPYMHNPTLPFFQILVPTIDTVRYRWLAQNLLANAFPVFFTGPTGVGKTVVLQDMFERLSSTSERILDKSLDPPALEGLIQLFGEGPGGALSAMERQHLASAVDFLPLVINFSARSSSGKTQETIESRLIKLKATTYGAPQGKRLVVHIDDVNMPVTEKYGAQPPIELLRQILDYGGFYDRSTLVWKELDNATLVCSAAPPGGGRSQSSPRFVRHFSLFHLPPPSEAVLKKIFTAIYSGWAQNGFKQAVLKLSDPIVASSIELYQSMSRELLPTPAKSHYTFNLRDISKVFQGILSIKPASCSAAETMVRLWVHECQRCFEDRLVNATDKLWCTQKLTFLLQKNFGSEFPRGDTLFKKQQVAFCDFMNEGDRMYEEVRDPLRLIEALESRLADYNAEVPSHQMNLVFFEDAVKHVTRITRIIRQPRGNAMLVGVGGSGKQSLTRLACYLAGYQCMQPEVTRSFTYADFQEFLKALFIRAGVKGENVVFLFTETQIVQERFLEDVNNVLNSGEVPNLFPKDEFMKVIEELTPIVRDQGLNATVNVVHNAFVQRVRDNVHVVLCLSPVGEAFRQRCRQYPSLISCTTIDWFTPWPRSALLSVSESVLATSELKLDASVVQALARECMEIHVSVEEACDRFRKQHRRNIYTTPKSYLDMLALFRHMFESLSTKINTRRLHLLTGLKRLKDTAASVGELKETLAKLKPSLEDKARETERLLAEVAADTQKADLVRLQVEKEEKEISEQTEDVRKEELEAQNAVDLARPALDEAKAAANRIKPAEMSEMRKMTNPPRQITRVMEAVCILMGRDPTPDDIKALYATSGLVNRMLEVLEKVELRQIRRAAPYIEDPELAGPGMVQVSRTAANLMQWVTSVSKYYYVQKDVEPKEARVRQLKKQLQSAEEVLHAKQAELNKVLENVRQLQARCRATEEEKRVLDERGRLTEARLERASQLTHLLSDEEKRWSEDADKLQRKLDVLVGDAFISSACVSYYGGFTGEYRAALVSQWLAALRAANVPVSESYTLQSCLGTPMEIRQWCIEGLPSDDVSIDSAICATEAKRWPLMVDPQGQAKKWVKSGKRSFVQTARMNDDKLLKVVERCVREGHTLLIEDIGEKVDAALDPVLNHQIFTEAGRRCIRIGDQTIEYHPSFRLFMTTKLPNPHYLPEVCIKVTLLNFTVTRQGMEDQLLGEVVKKERADVEERKNSLVLSMSNDRKELANLEDRILNSLQTSQTHILDDIDLIQTLKTSKATAQVIDERMTQTIETQRSNDEIRAKYVPVATRGALMYFVISELAMVDPMYQFSLEFFVRFFNVCMDQASQGSSLDQRLQHLLDHITQAFYGNICRGLFEKHKLTFSFNLMTSILRHRGDITPTEWSVFVRGSGSAPLAAPRDNPMPDDLPAPAWVELQRLEQAVPAVFNGLTRSMCEADRVGAWRAWLTSHQIAALQAPDPFAGISPFARLLLIKAARFSQVLPTVSEFIRAYPFGRGLTTPQQTSLADVYKDSDHKTPVIFVLSTGADPTDMLLRFAAQLNMGERLQMLSLGQGQGENAKRLITEASSKGDWVMLQNCHLSKSWMPELEALVEQLDDDERKVAPTFRLWLTSMPSEHFPVSVLQRGIKLTNEPPKGLRANLLRSYYNILRADQLEYHPGKGDAAAAATAAAASSGGASSAAALAAAGAAASGKEWSKMGIWKKLSFGLIFFHATIQERKRFGPMGWNKGYEWNDSDLETSLKVLRMALEENDHVPWDALTYITGHICYGGRVTDDWDRRCLMAILSQFYTPRIESDQYRFSASGVYYAPPKSAWEDYVGYVQSLPQLEDPEVFGMGENANILFLNQEAEAVLRTVRSVQPRDLDDAQGKSSDEIVNALAAEMEAKLPALLDLKEAGPNTFPEPLEEPENPDEVQVDSLNEFLKQEVDRYNRLLTVVRQSLGDLQKAIHGFVVMSQDLDYMYDDLLNNRVPEMWARVAPPSLMNLASWMVDLHRRIAFIRDWLKGGKPVSYWLPGFFFLHGFLTGVLQTHARRYHIPIDTISFSFRILSDVPDPAELKLPAEDGVYIHGLFTTGAIWDCQTDMLADAPVGELVSALPVIHFLPKENYSMAPADYACPVYQTAVRAGVLSTTGQSTNFVLDVHLATKRDPNYWILNGVAILCQPDSA